MLLLEALILWPKRAACLFPWLGVLTARLIVGHTFMVSGWGKLQNIDGTIEFFGSLGIPFPAVLGPVVAGWEALGGLLLILGLMTRLTAGGLAVIMLVAIATAKWAELEGLFDILSNPEATYFAVFTWLAVSGAGPASLDYRLESKARARGEQV